MSYDHKISYVLVLGVTYNKNLFQDVVLSPEIPYVSLQINTGYMVRTLYKHAPKIDKGSRIPILTFIVNDVKYFIVNNSLVITIDHLGTDESQLIDKFVELTKVTVDTSDVIRTQYALTYTIHGNICWIPSVYAYIINLDPTLRNLLCYTEILRPISIKSKQLLYVNVNDTYMTAFIRSKYNGLIITISKGLSIENIHSSYDIIQSSLETYLQAFEQTCSILQITEIPDLGDLTIKNMDILRRIDPELFISGYSRECPIPPIYASNDDTTSFVLEYPRHSGNFYKSPEGYFIGLKINNMSNNKKYKYLINCYKEDHTVKMSSKLYSYLHHEDSPRARRPKTYLNIPTNIRSFTDISHRSLFQEKMEPQCIFTSKIPRNFLPQLARQECYDMTNEDIYAMLVDHNMPIDISSTYRCFEHIFQINIFIMVLDNNLLSHKIPSHYGNYYWTNKYSRSIIVIETRKNTYGTNDIIYSALFTNGEIIFDNTHPLVQLIISQKVSLSMSPEYPFDDLRQVSQQFIDSYGKCTIVFVDGTTMSSNCEPLPVPCTNTYEFMGNFLHDIRTGLELNVITNTEYKHLIDINIIMKETYIHAVSTKFIKNSVF